MQIIHAPTELLDSLSADLSQQVKERTDQLLLEIIRPNSASQFARQAPELASFCEAVAKDPKDDLELLRNFRESVPLTGYEAYKPFIAKFFSTPCKEDDVEDLLAPGLPDFLAASSATSGKAPKIFPKYQPPPQCQWQPLQPFSSLESVTLVVYSLNHREIVNVESKNSPVPKKLVFSSAIDGLIRMQMGWNIEDDHKRLDLIVQGQVAPYAISLIRNYRSSLLLYALFALANPRVTTICLAFATLFVNMLQYVEDEWLVIVDCIEQGIIPDLEITEDVREALEKNMTPDPLRAAELREIGPPSTRTGWAVHVWPALKTYISIVGGTSAAVVPKITQILGPSVCIRSPGYGSSECMIAIPYDNGDPATDLKIRMLSAVIEFIESSSDETPRTILSSWELVAGRQYEPILTTRDGLWRYRIGDIILVKGFAPEDGMPVVNYVGRQDGLLKLASLTVTESELTGAIISAAKLSIGQLAGFVVVMDDREAPISFGYIAEVVGEIGNDAHLATQYALEDMMASNEEYRIRVEQGKCRKPTIRLVEKGTFAEFRRLRCEKTKTAMPQIKVPVVLFDQSSQEWLLERVVMEL